MIVEAYTGVGGDVIRLPDLAQVIVRDENGTIVMVASLYGPNGAMLVSHAKDPQHNENLKRLRINETVICESVSVSEGVERMAKKLRGRRS